MKFIYSLTFIWLLTGHAMAQPGTEASGVPDSRAQQEQRRTELRSALQAPRKAGELPEPRKQLSPRERSELRQQLRQQQHDADKRKP